MFIVLWQDTVPCRARFGGNVFSSRKLWPACRWMWVQYNLTTAVMGAAVIVEMPASLKHSLQCQGMGHISGMSFQSAAVWLCTLATRPKVSADLHVCTHRWTCDCYAKVPSKSLLHTTPVLASLHQWTTCVSQCVYTIELKWEYWRRGIDWLVLSL